MVKESITYPIFRKYEGNRSFFKINSLKDFTEVQVMANRFFIHEIKAKTFPDFQLIVDMINLHNNHWIESSKEEFEQAMLAHKEKMSLAK